MRELAAAARSQGIHPCWYHSIMDWHHPDYLPRRDWEAETRSAAGARHARYREYLHAQVGELLTKYGDIGVMWFDGQWEGSWTHEMGRTLYARCRALQPERHRQQPRRRLVTRHASAIRSAISARRSRKFPPPDGPAWTGSPASR